MARLVFLYNGREGSAQDLRDALSEALQERGIGLWTDVRASDPGFYDEFLREIGFCDGIVFVVGPSGLGRYQERNELNRVYDALQANLRRRLVFVILDDADVPPERAHFDVFGSRVTTIKATDEVDLPGAVRRAALPGDVVETSGEMERTLASQFAARARDNKNLVIVLGPYAFAETADTEATPAHAIRNFMRARKLRGYAPWFDVMGSIARAMANDDDEAAAEIIATLSPNAMQKSGLGEYLRMVAANWSRTPGTGKLFIVTCSPDLRVDLSLRSASAPVQHLRLVHRPRDNCDALFAERVTVENGQPVRTTLGPDGNVYSSTDKVVLIKPLGCVEVPDQALLTSEQWRQVSAEMPLPTQMAQDMTRGMMLAFGAGVFAPSYQILFRTLLPKALEAKDNNLNRYLIHNPSAKVADPLHRIEAWVLKSEQNETFEEWIKYTYGLRVRYGDSISLLSWLDYHLNN